ncbi:hypothetical protein QJQ45_012679 [Haematococcus lacustris]|nr:hypothetical protein QJQ45_012679 [Haematococcus lacustris]
MDEDVRQRRQPAMPPPRGNSPASPILLDAEQLHRPTWENDDLETLVNDSQLMAALSTTASHNVSTAHPTPTHDRPMQASRIKKALHILYQPVVHHQQAVKAKQPLPATPPRAPTQPQPTGLCPQGEPTAAPVLQGLASGGPKNGLEDSPACSQHDVWPGDASAAAGAPSAPGPSASSSDQYPQAPPPDAGSGSGSFTDNPDLAEVMNQLHGQHEDASGSGQQVQGQGQAAKVGIAEERQVIKAALRGLVEAALPNLSPAQVDAVVAEVNKRMTMGSKQCVLAAVVCLSVLLQSFLVGYVGPTTVGTAMELLTQASVLEHLRRGPHHRGIRLLPGEVAVFDWVPPAGQVNPRLGSPPLPAQAPPAQAPPPPPPAQAQPLPAAPGPAPPPQAPPGGRWLDRDTNGCLNLQRIGESRQRPIELCRWDDLYALPPIGKEYQQGYKLVNDRLPKGRQWLHRAAEYRRGIDGRARNNA